MHSAGDDVTSPDPDAMAEIKETSAFVMAKRTLIRAIVGPLARAKEIVFDPESL